ncbi:hypothetical protein EYF80_060555 [Liparis tanakae]|uniref:Uncharacterized protein n=1 Tax=Liparis tanakae TaxID=230148 RepID=A0A4Z2EK48_9TELE|nr:hypothetical protein EYF80_060555 [Liparis tanakae]
MKSPYSTGWQVTASSKLQSNSWMQSCRSPLNQSLSSAHTRRSWKTRQLSWYQSRSSCSLSWKSHKDALEHFGQVSEVEGVVGLGWSGEELGGDGGVHSDRGVYERLVQRLDDRHRS